MICDLKTHYTLISIEMLDAFSAFSLLHMRCFFRLLLPFFALENWKELQLLSMCCVRLFCFIRFLYYGPYYSLFVFLHFKMPFALLLRFVRVDCFVRKKCAANNPTQKGLPVYSYTIIIRSMLFASSTTTKYYYIF